METFRTLDTSVIEQYSAKNLADIRMKALDLCVQTMPIDTPPSQRLRLLIEDGMRKGYWDQRALEEFACQLTLRTKHILPDTLPITFKYITYNTQTKRAEIMGIMTEKFPPAEPTVFSLLMLNPRQIITHSMMHDALERYHPFDYLDRKNNRVIIYHIRRRIGDKHLPGLPKEFRYIQFRTNAGWILDPIEEN